jgi:AraC-like DNA-binding protein
MGFNLSVESFGFVVQREPDPGWHIVGLAHPELFVIAFAHRGKVLYEVDGSPFTVSQGDLVWFPPGKVHTATSDPEDPWKFCSVGFTLTDLGDSGLSVLDSVPNRVRVSNHFQIGALLEELVHEWTGKRLAYLLRCRSIVEEVLFSVIRAVDREEQKKRVPHVFGIEKTARLIEQYPERSFTVGELAERASLSEPYYRKLFKQVTGYTPVQYQHWIKVNRAKDLLLSGECNVSEAAFQLGFDNVYYFSRLFKRVARINPSEYLKR